MTKHITLHRLLPALFFFFFVASFPARALNPTCSSYPLPFIESFSGTTLPGCWTQIDHQGNGQIWQFGTLLSTTYPYFSGNYAFLDSDNYGSGNSQNVDLITPTINCTGVNAVELSFKYCFVQYPGSSGSISFSIDNGITWSTLTTITTSSTSNPEIFSQEIPQVAGYPQVKFRWNYTGTWGYYWAIDDVHVASVCPVPANQAYYLQTFGGLYTDMNLKWKRGSGGGTLLVARAGAPITAEPLNGTVYIADTVMGNGSDLGNGTYVIYSGSDTTCHVTNLQPGTWYYFTLFEYGLPGYCYKTPGSAYISNTLCTKISTFPYTENFEHYEYSPVCWEQQYVNGTLLWTFDSGGGGGGIPSSAHSGSYNARLYEGAAGTINIQKLRSPSFDLTNRVNNTLSFWYTQAASSLGQDVLKVYYKTSIFGSWVLLATYSDNVTTWTKRTVALPNPSNDYYFAFEGTEYGGHGICIDDLVLDGVPVTLNVSPSSRQVPASASATSFIISTPTTWTASSSSTWCTVTPSGTGNDTLIVNCQASTYLSPRTALITVTVPGLSPVIVSVTQEAYNPILSVTPTNQNVTEFAGTTTFSVTANNSWTASSDQGWCTVTPSGTGNGSIVATYSANNTLISRTAHITVSMVSTGSVILTVTQDAKVPILTVSPASQNVNNLAGTVSFTVNSNSAWTSVSDQPWCSATQTGSGNGVINANFTQNNIFTPRTATITITTEGISPVTVTVTQAAALLPDFRYTMDNDIQTSDRTFEFDLLLLDSDPGQPFELASVQAGIFVNPAIYNGGTLTAAIVPGSSTLNPSQQPTGITFTQSANIIKLAAKAPPGAGNGTLVSTNSSNPSRICRVKLTNSVPFAQAAPNLAFSFSTQPYATKISQYVNGINTSQLVNSSNCYSECTNGLLNPPAAVSVNPLNQTVTSSAGSAIFTVSCNAAWSVESSQSWCTVGAGGFGNGSLVVNYEENPSGEERIATITVSVQNLDPVILTLTQNGLQYRTLHLNLQLEGLSIAPGVMRASMDEAGPHWGASIADKISVEFRDAADYQHLVYSISNIDLNTNGTATLTFPVSLNGSYYLTILHRSSLETVSAAPVSFSAPTTTYSFDNASKAYGGNLKQLSNGTWAIYSGDVEKDGLIDASDMIILDNANRFFSTGYLIADLNGDGLVDSEDLVLLDNNSSNFVARLTP